MEDQTLANWRFVFQRILVPIVVIIGVFGNFVSVIILTQRRMRCSTNIYLTALAVMDIIYLLFIFILSLAHYPNINSIKYEVFWRTFGLSHWLCDATNNSSIYLTVSFTIERYIAVCHPIRGQVLCTESRAKRVIAGVILACFVLTMSTAFEYRLITEARYTNIKTGGPCNRTETSSSLSEMLQITSPNSIDPFPDLSNNSNSTERLSEIENEYNITTPEIICEDRIYVRATESTMSSNYYYKAIFYPFTTFTFIFLPLILLATFNIFLVTAVHRSHKMRQSITRMRNTDAMTTQENKITNILIAVVLLFLLCQTPTATYLIYSLVPGANTSSNLVLALGNLCNFLTALNAASNFILYCALSDKYRQTMKSLLCKKGGPRRQNTMNSTRNVTKEVELVSVSHTCITNPSSMPRSIPSNKIRSARISSISSASMTTRSRPSITASECTDVDVHSRKSSHASMHNPLKKSSSGNYYPNNLKQNSLTRSQSLIARPVIKHSFDCKSAVTKF